MCLRLFIEHNEGNKIREDDRAETGEGDNNR